MAGVLAEVQAAATARQLFALDWQVRGLPVRECCRHPSEDTKMVWLRGVAWHANLSTGVGSKPQPAAAQDQEAGTRTCRDWPTFLT